LREKISVSWSVSKEKQRDACAHNSHSHSRCFRSPLEGRALKNAPGEHFSEEPACRADAREQGSIPRALKHTALLNKKALSERESYTFVVRRGIEPLLPG
jgi:hypothetical protein